MNEVFEAFRNCISDRKCENKDCPYDGKCQIANGRDQYIQIPKHLALDVLNILKEKEPAKPIARNDSYFCEKCRGFLCNTGKASDVKFCSYCGNPVDWT